MTPKNFWDFIMASQVASTTPPESRFSLPGHYDGSQKPYTMKTPGAMFMDVDPSDFDAGFFGINHMDASSMDPQQRQLLEVAHECLENAGIPLETLHGARVGCLVGANTVGMLHIHHLSIHSSWNSAKSRDVQNSDAVRRLLRHDMQRSRRQNGITDYGIQ